MAVTVAVDAGGADRGPSEVAEAALLAVSAGIHVVLFGPAEQLSAAHGAPGIEIVDAPVSIAKAGDPVRAVRAAPESSIVQAAQAVAAADGAASVVSTLLSDGIGSAQ